MKQKIAIPLEGVPSVVLLDNGERMTRANAVKAGYHILDSGSFKAADAQGAIVDKVASWRLAIECLPEARGRASAVSELLTSRNPETLSIEAARAFLRGLPVETSTEQTEETNMTNTDPKAARLAEIKNSMAAFNQHKGYAGKAAQPENRKAVEPAKLKRLAEIRLNAMDHNGRGMTQEAKVLRLALQSHATTGTPIDRLFAQLGFDASKLIPANI